MIGRLRGHSEPQATERYDHLSADWVKESGKPIAAGVRTDIFTGHSDFSGVKFLCRLNGNHVKARAALPDGRVLGRGRDLNEQRSD